MGYMRYDTPLGPAGYGVADTCHEPDCNEKIDRGLAYLCGDTPGEPDEHGCGEWFCGQHLFMGPSVPHGFRGGGLCSRCIEAGDPEAEFAAAAPKGQDPEE